MNRLIAYTLGFIFAAIGAGTAWAGEASTSAYADSGWGRNSGTAIATADWDGDGGRGYTQTRTQTGRVNLARGLSVGVDRDGVDFSFSHAIAGQRGPGYAGTFNLSIGRDGSVSTGYGQSVALGGIARSVEAGGTTSSSRNGTVSLARAGGDTRGGGIVRALTQSHGRPAVRPQFVRLAGPRRHWR